MRCLQWPPTLILTLYANVPWKRLFDLYFGAFSPWVLAQPHQRWIFSLIKSVLFTGAARISCEVRDPGHVFPFWKDHVNLPTELKCPRNTGRSVIWPCLLKHTTALDSCWASSWVTEMFKDIVQHSARSNWNFIKMKISVVCVNSKTILWICSPNQIC